MWTDQGWFIHQLKVRICFLSLSFFSFIYLRFSTLYSRSLWTTDTIVFVKLNKPTPPPPPPPPHQISPPSLLDPTPPQMCLK